MKGEYRGLYVFKLYYVLQDTMAGLISALSGSIKKFVNICSIYGINCHEILR